ncbi:adenomatous polyposis coli protein-like [Anopheles nili]|uniref:adenomatous polyposis coli protein-like n=1 Tax=Anopheles nili TaxID=185578 RepID=UPI00237B81B0|nr:adenomatous polyposis coli protein-like [Anopheles nili]
MPKPSDENLCSLGKRTLSPPDSSLDDLELESCIEELDNLGDLTDSGLSRKPHFLDYDNKPPAELVEQHHKWNGVALANEAATDEPECEPLYKHVPAEPVQPLPVVPLLHMNVSYEATTALNILPTSTTKKQPPAVGSRGGTWPLKERVSATRRQHHSLNRDLAEVGPKMECVYSLLSMLGSTNVLEMSSKFLELSRNDEKCSALRRSGCVPLLVHIIHNEPNEAARRNARHALVNVIRCNVDETSVRRELKVLRLIDQLIDYTDLLKEQTAGSEPSADRQTGMSGPPEQERHPIQAIGTLAKISYDEEHRHAMCQFGALQTIASLIQLDHLAHGPVPDALKCIEMRRYASMVLTNLTFGQGNNKALLCANREFMRALVAQLECAELVQVTASVLRNLSWRADTVTKQTLVEIGTVKVLTEAAMRCTVENTLKSILSALWNLSNHCSQNRSRICEVTGALEFLIELLTYEAPSKTMSIVENAGGILRNISSHIAQCEPYRRVLRERNCLKILLDQLKSPSLTVVSNACGTLGNLSSDNGEDQQFLRENGAVPMLRSLIYSKHNIISNGSRLALKNLQNRPVTGVDQQPPVVAASLTNGGVLPVKGVPTGKTPEPVGNGLPGLNVRKQRAMEQELGCAFYARKDEDLSEDESAGGKVSDDAEPVDPSAVRVELVDERLAAEPETPINYGLKDGMQQSSYDYQETDIDQLTDYSLRYAENQSESEDEKGDTYRADPVNMLIPEDSVKCYYTEGTPQIISSATSMSDLRGASVVGATSAAAGTASGVSNAGDSSAVPFKQPSVVKSNPIPIGRGQVAGDDLGCNTPDKPYNYCEEGTPDFSRDASLGILDLPHDGGGGKQPEEDGKPVPPGVDLLEAVDATESGLPGPTTGKSVSFLNTADETPLMFSRTSSMGSLSSAEPACTDDKSSIVSEFSRMASGVMSPSELPDSPTETVAHSPRRCPPKEKPVPERPPVTSAFADTVSKFNVEHTPAQFSCATSLSNLSIELEDSRDVTVEDGTGGERVDRRSSPVLPNPAELLANAGEVGDVPGSDGDSDAGEDDELLASCISIGMSSVVARSAAAKKNPPTATFPHLATGQSTGEPVDPVEPHFLRYRERGGDDSDDSSNLSDNNDRLLEECILSGMPKPKHPIDGLHPGSLLPRPLQLVDSERDPFKMMRNPVHLQPLMANDELNPFHVEDSPCNFSTVSTLSELTVASDTMAVQRTPRGRMEPIATGLVSSPSIESEADEYILDEAILAGIAGKGDKAHQRRSKSHGTVPEPTGGQRPPAGGSIPDDSDQEGDYQLLVECIRTGMRSSMKPPEEPVPRPDQQPGPSTLPAGSKNLRTTPVTSKDVGACEASAGVGKARPSRTPPVGGQRVAPSERLAGRYQRASSTTDNSRTGQPPVSSGYNSNNNAAGTCPEVTRTENEGIGCEVGALSGLSSCSGESQVLPVDRYIDGEASVADKHKNPELMLQSVERLTQALVSQAEDVWATPALEPAPVQFMIGASLKKSTN